MNDAVALHELTASPADIDRLRAFYADAYASEFPDPDERESLLNMERYLALKDEGWYGRNNYHIVIAERAGQPIGGFVIDYLETPNAGVIEFLFVCRDYRSRGLGRMLLRSVEELLCRDALERTGRSLDMIVAEMNDPFVRSDVEDNLDPFERAMIWGGWGYGVLDFPYVQPPLSAEQGAVTNLALIFKAFRADWQRAVPVDIVRKAVHQYLRWAMRIDEPDGCPQFRTMDAHLASRDTITVFPLDAYVGSPRPAPFEVQEVARAEDTSFDDAMRVFEDSFAAGPTVIDRDAFAAALKKAHEPAAACRYHLWVLRDGASARAQGMASFFSTSPMGFGGYVALRGSLEHVGALRPLLARIERQMIVDRDDFEGWIIECAHKTATTPFERIGFREIAVPFSQPDLREPGCAGPTVRLLYKPFGRVYGSQQPLTATFLASLRCILMHVYGAADPEKHPSYAAVARALSAQTRVPLTFPSRA